MMLEGGGGAIVNFSSTYGNGTNPENAINFVPVTYSTAKGAIRGFTTTLARDLAPEIRVNALAPGPISGEWETEWGVSPEHIDAWAADAGVGAAALHAAMNTASADRLANRATDFPIEIMADPPLGPNF